MSAARQTSKMLQRNVECNVHLLQKMQMTPKRLCAEHADRLRGAFVIRQFVLVATEIRVEP
jgi:hypothetical protein